MFPSDIRSEYFFVHLQGKVPDDLFFDHCHVDKPFFHFLNSFVLIGHQAHVNTSEVAFFTFVQQTGTSVHLYLKEYNIMNRRY